MPARTTAPLTLLGFFVAGCGDDAGVDGGSAEPPPATTLEAPWFEEVALERGLDFLHDSGHDERYLMPEIMCGGGALLDADGDGDLDAYLVQSGPFLAEPASRPGNQLFLNDGEGRFTDATAASGADDRGYGMGAACGDVDGDGDVELYVTNVGPNALLSNLGAGRFEDVTGAAGVGDGGFGASAAFFDYDLDGHLDLLTLNYLHWSAANELECFNAQGLADYCSPQTYASPARDVLYRNRGDGTFADATVAAGLDRAIGNGLGLACGDFNGDGLPDVFVANDGMPDHLWINQGEGKFVDEALFAGCAVDQDGRPKAGMGVTVVDLDDDGDLDLLVCNLANETDSLFLNQGGYFRDSTAVAGLGLASRPFTRFGMAWFDFDQDGALDLFQANGRVNRQATLYSDDPFAEPNMLFRGEGTRFEVVPNGGTREELIATSRAACFGDVDGDGAVDVLVVNRDERAHLLRNVAPARGSAVLLRAVGPSGADALGATLTLDVGKRRITRDVRAAFSYQASNDPRVHVGLGNATRVDNVVVRWPDGAREGFGGFDAGGVVTLRRGEGQAVPD